MYIGQKYYTKSASCEAFLGYSIWEFSHKLVHNYTAWITECVADVSDREIICDLVNSLR